MQEMNLLLVIGESPQEAANSVANPEDSVNQHRSEGLLTDPVVLETQLLNNNNNVVLTAPAYLASDGIEDKRVVVCPATVTALLRNSLNKTDDRPSHRSELVLVVLLVLQA